jgi:hypothetical protein
MALHTVLIAVECGTVGDDLVFNLLNNRDLALS